VPPSTYDARALPIKLDVRWLTCCSGRRARVAFRPQPLYKHRTFAQLKAPLLQRIQAAADSTLQEWRIYGNRRCGLTRSCLNLMSLCAQVRSSRICVR